MKLPYDDPMPEELLQRMVAYRIREFEDDGVNWV